jgi:diguanylate cyclase (GGDEF)-like protein
VTDEGVRTLADGRGWYDGETGLFGPRSWAAILETESARCARYRRTATVVIAEVVGLDELESVWGADIAPPAVMVIGSVLRSGARPSDYVARLGPRRFGILLPETDEIAAVNFVERVRERCIAAAKQADPDAHCSFGWADATKSRLLSAAADLAIERLALDDGAH